MVGRDEGGGGGTAMSKKDQSIMPCLDERMKNMIEALFAFWANKKSAMPAESFY